MRSPEELIEDLKDTARHFAFLSIVIFFENHTEYVHSNDKNQLSKLKEFIAQGGEPIGFMGITKKKNHIDSFYEPLMEYENEGWVLEYLCKLSEAFFNNVCDANPDAVGYCNKEIKK